MTAIDPQLLEQLSAWMDGELPADEARFLQRRLHNDKALREQWERWQIASACLRGQPVARMDADLPGRITAGIAQAANDPQARRPKLAWLASAAALVLAVALLPRMLAVDPAPLPSVRDFPLVDNGGKAWPRSPLLAEPRARGALLVRNELPIRVPADADGRPKPPTGEAGQEAGKQ